MDDRVTRSGGYRTQLSAERSDGRDLVLILIG
jgi:hypothetical protein